MTVRRLSFLLGLASAACAPLDPPPVATRTVTTEAPDASVDSDAAPDGAACPADLRQFLAAHGQMYGTASALDALGPLVLQAAAGENAVRVLVDGVRSTFTMYRGRTPPLSRGVDQDGAWLFFAGGRFPLRPDEALEPLFDRWVAHRSYVTDFDPAKDEILCGIVDDKPLVVAVYKRPDLGNPKLMFDAETKALLRANQTRSGGGLRTTAYDGWEKRQGVSFPTSWRDSTLGGTLKTVGLVLKSGALASTCSQSASPSAAPAAEDCFADPAIRMSVSVPTKGATFPMSTRGGEMFLVTKDGEALVDTGAPNMMLTGPRPDFVPSMDFDIRGPSAFGEAAFGEMDEVTVGPIVMRHVTAVRAPSLIQELTRVSPNLPWMILGLPLMARASIRFDNVRRTISIGGADADALPAAANVTSLPVRILNEVPVVEATVNGSKALLMLDSGSGSSVSLRDSWAHEHDLPGNEPTLESSQLEVGGTQATTQVRLRSLALGGQTFDRPIATIHATTTSGDVVGEIGNRVFEKCRAVTLDIPARLLRLEGPCDRPATENHAGVSFLYDAHPGAPSWVVVHIAKGSPADRVGIQLGDRIVSVAGLRESKDPDPWERIFQRRPGTRVDVIFERAGKRQTVALMLATLL